MLQESRVDNLSFPENSSVNDGISKVEFAVIHVSGHSRGLAEAAVKLGKVALLAKLT